MLKIVKCAWENSDVSSSVQDFYRLHFEIVTSAAASTPKEVRAYPQRGSGPVSQAHLERGLRLDLFTKKFAPCCLPEATCVHRRRHDVGLSLWPVSLKVFGCYSNLKENVGNNFKYSYLIY